MVFLRQIVGVLIGEDGATVGKFGTDFGGEYRGAAVEQVNTVDADFFHLGADGG